MSVYSDLITFAVVGIPAGLALGAGLGLVARRDDGWGGYDSFPRRATRLGHIAAVMLPLLAGFYALLLDALPGHDPEWAARGVRLWIAGGCALPVVLFLAAWRRQLANLLPLPALTLVAAASALAWAVVGASGGIPS